MLVFRSFWLLDLRRGELLHVGKAYDFPVRLRKLLRYLQQPGFTTLYIRRLPASPPISRHGAVLMPAGNVISGKRLQFFATSKTGYGGIARAKSHCKPARTAFIYLSQYTPLKVTQAAACSDTSEAGRRWRSWRRRSWRRRTGSELVLPKQSAQKQKQAKYGSYGKRILVDIGFSEFNPA